ncbi:type IV secretory system conjugative DNA transfer family protein [Stenotrophomonas maltophilia]|uniref:type IV secretory system conjugative DNA transfer family protein n=1 Tax=Stenotrophomonas maltophilia TaxID=40324 RepID=UPI0021C7D3A8|nr:type IV secretory system conjugative DNA transfer family protein [Stenotrophomonas maltophilia]MCU1124910.1 type IV secretory system conjugative DNA transfer family protein [Stenotrophomonas maltophilia]
MADKATVKRWFGIALLIPFLALATCWIAGFAFVLWNWRELAFMPTPLTYFQYLEKFWHARELRLSFVVSGGAPALLSLILITAALLYRPRPTLYGDGRWANLSELEEAEMIEQPQGVPLGMFKGKVITSHPEHHVELKAATGTGKGVSLVIPTLLLWKGSVVVNDIKGENFELTSKYRQSRGHKVFVFNPSDKERRTHRWNPFEYVDRDVMLRNKGIGRIAAMFWNPAEDEGEPWKPGARDLFLTASLWHLENGLELTLPNVARFGAMMDEEAIKKAVKAREAAGEPYPENVVEGFVKFFSKPDKYRESVRGEFNTGMEIVTNDPLVSLALSGNDFNLRRFRKDKMALYVVTPGPDLGRLRPLLNLMWQQIAAENTETEFAQDPECKHQLMLLNDEFTSLGDVSEVVDPISYYRSYGVKLVTIYQTQSQIVGVYGESRASTFRDNHKTRVVYTPTSKEEAKLISEELPTTTSYSKSESGRKLERKTHSKNEAARALMIPDEVRLLPSSEAIIFFPGYYPARIKRLTYFERKELYSRLQSVSPILARKRIFKPNRKDYNKARQAGELRIAVAPLDLPAAPTPKASGWASQSTATFRPATAADLATLGQRPANEIRINGKELPALAALNASPQEKRAHAASLVSMMFGNEEGEDEDSDLIGS